MGLLFMIFGLVEQIRRAEAPRILLVILRSVRPGERISWPEICSMRVAMTTCSPFAR